MYVRPMTTPRGVAGMPPARDRSGAELDAYRGWRMISAVLLAAVLCTSCGRQSGPVAQEQVNLAWLGHMYGMYISQNKGDAPKTIDDLRKFVEKRANADLLARLKVTSVGELFVSPRDGKPFEMVTYAKLPSRTGGEPPPIVFYEELGKDGQRAIALLGGGTRTVDENELLTMLPASSKRGP